MDREEATRRVRQHLLGAVSHVRRHRRFHADLVEQKRVPALVEPELFIEVFDSAVRPIIVAAEHCRLSLCKEQLPDIDRIASESSDSLPGRLARNLLAKWREVGATPDAWMEAFTRRVNPPVKDHLRDDTVHPAYYMGIQFTTESSDVEIDLSSDAVNTPLLWWWLFCGGLDIESVFMMNTAIVSAPAFWRSIVSPHGIVCRPDFAERFARRQTTRSTRVAMMVLPYLQLKTVAAAPVIEQLYRVAVQSAVVRNERYESWVTEQEVVATEGTDV